MFEKMKAIDYNTMMTIIGKIQTEFPTYAQSYGITGKTIDISPSYPRNLSKFDKPAIIIRKVGTSQELVGLGGVLGRYYDGETNTWHDVSGISHDSTIQFDICTDNNTDDMMFTSSITEYLNEIRLSNSGNVKLMDYTNMANIKHIGTCKVVGEISTTNVESSDLNNNYLTAIRFDINILQAIVPQQEFVDLSKWIKTRYKIKL